jgi:hypothetical protein
MGTLRARRTDDVEDLADQPVDRGGTDLGVGRTVVSEVEAPNINMRTSGIERMSGGAKRQCGQDHRSVGDLPLEEVKALGEAVLAPEEAAASGRIVLSPRYGHIGS